MASRNDGWSRQGLFRFTFKILTLNTGAVLATKEACDHAFSHKTSNWGWAQFSSRDTVFYNNAEVQQSNAFLISVTITANAERPRPLTVGVSVPPALVEAMGSLLDDPDHSDVVFVIRRKRRHPATGVIVTRERRIYAIKKILASRCEYFRDMFDSGFLEADATASSSDDEMQDHPSFAPPSSRGLGQDQLGRPIGALASFSDEDDDDLALEDSDEELDADEVYEMGTWNLHEDARRDDILMARQATALPPASSTDTSASRHQRETSSDVPQVWPTSAATVAPTPFMPPRKQPSQQNTPPQSRSRQNHDQDAGTDSGEDAARAPGMSAFQTPQHSPRELRNDGATDLSQLRDALPARAKPAAQPLRECLNVANRTSRRGQAHRQARRGARWLFATLPTRHTRRCSTTSTPIPSHLRLCTRISTRSLPRRQRTWMFPTTHWTRSAHLSTSPTGPAVRRTLAPAPRAAMCRRAHHRQRRATALPRTAVAHTCFASR